jgi:hypothetical protein
MWQYETGKMYPPASLVIASHDNLLLLHSKRKGLEMWLLTFENTCVEAVLDERV